MPDEFPNLDSPEFDAWKSAKAAVLAETIQPLYDMELINRAGVYASGDREEIARLERWEANLDAQKAARGAEPPSTDQEHADYQEFLRQRQVLQRIKHVGRTAVRAAYEELYGQPPEVTNVILMTRRAALGFGA